MAVAVVDTDVFGLFDLRALAPVPNWEGTARPQATRLLDIEMETIGFKALLAISKGWDSRRIGFPNESAHPFEQEVAAILGVNQGHATEHLKAAQRRLDEHKTRLEDMPYLRSIGTPVGQLASEFGLSPLAVDLLLVIAAPSLWGEAARLYGILSNDSTRALVDELLATHVLDVSRYGVAPELEPSAPLRRFGLIHVGQRARPFSPLSADPVVLARLRGQEPDFGPDSATRVRRADRDLTELLAPPDVILAALRYLAREYDPERPPRIAIRGRAGSGRRTLLATLAAKANRALGVIDATRLPRRLADFLPALTAELRRAMLRGLLPCVTRLEDVTFEEHLWRDFLTDALRQHSGPIAVRLPADGTPPFDPGYLALDLPMPSESQRLDVWQATTQELGLEVSDVASLAARYRVGPGTIHHVISTVAHDRAEEGRLIGDATADLEKRMHQMRDIQLGQHARKVMRLARWDSLVLPDECLDSVRELIGRVRHRRTVYDDWGFDSTMSTSRSLSAIFQGPPGTGKTMVAGVIARELGLELYQVDLSKVVSKWIGETEKNLSSIFDAAEDGQVVLLFDEADSLFAKRTEVKSSHDRYANLEVNYLLQRLDAFEGIAILTTNFAGSIDPALKRRLSFRIYFPFPDEETRQQLWRVHLPKELPISGPLDFAMLARKFQLAGGYIRNACLRAAFLAAEEGMKLSQSHLERAVALEFADLGKLSTSGSIE